MSSAVPAEISVQLLQALDVIQRNLESTLLAVHLYGSALQGGLRPCSDIDLLVTVTARIDAATRQALLTGLLGVSAAPGKSRTLRALEVTVVVRSDIVPWRYPPRRELQFGEWQRKDILGGIFEPAVVDADLAILITKARQHGKALAGPPAEDFFAPVSASDLFRTLTDTLELWHSPPDWAGDERNVVLTLARIWHSLATGRIVPKDVAASWVLERLPVEHQSVLMEARQAYLGHGAERWSSRTEQLTAFVHFVKRAVAGLPGVAA
jgi:streptomycin 3"-adenylyltransferase